MRSALYECRVMHHRFAPKQHRFSYGIFYLAIDLDELDALHRNLRGFSVGRRNLYSFREQDYFPVNEPLHNGGPSTHGVPLDGNLKTRVTAYLGRHGIDLTGGRVVLLTLPRVFGYLFNPVSFYFCFDRSGRAVASIAEVTNTFREVKPFVVLPEEFFPANSARDAAPTRFHLRAPKQFYVSPYSSVDVAFDFTLRVPGERVAIQIDDYAGAERLLISTLTGQRRPLTSATLFAATLRHPLVTLKIIGLIHWHALLLLRKRVPWFPKAANAAAQKGLYRPEPSIASTS